MPGVIMCFAVQRLSIFSRARVQWPQDLRAAFIVRGCRYNGDAIDDIDSNYFVLYNRIVGTRGRLCQVISSGCMWRACEDDIAY